MATTTEPTQFPTTEPPKTTETSRTDLPNRPLTGSTTASSGTSSGTPSSTSGPQSSGDLMSRVVQGAHQTIDRLAGRAAPHVDRLEEKLVDADQVLHERADQLREAGQGYVRNLRESVRENPLAAVGAALVLGLLIARLTR